MQQTMTQNKAYKAASIGFYIGVKTVEALMKPPVTPNRKPKVATATSN